MKKRAFGFGLAAAMLLSMAPLSASAEEAERYALKDAYTGDSEQGPVWYYMYNDGEEWKELSHYAEWGDNWQVSADPEGDDIYFSLFDWEGVKATSGEKDGTVYDIAAVWEAPAAGFVAVDAWTFDDLYAGDDTEWAFVANENTEGKVRIEQNGEKLWPEDAEWAEIQAENNVSDEGLTYVEEGDRLFFRVSGAVANVTMDSIAVEYVDIGMDVYMASDALASDQQGPVWYFQYNDGDGWKDLHLNEEWSGKDEQENIIAANWQVARPGFTIPFLTGTALRPPAETDMISLWYGKRRPTALPLWPPGCLRTCTPAKIPIGNLFPMREPRGRSVLS